MKQTKEHTTKTPASTRAVPKNNMQREKHVKPMTGRDAGEHGKSWADHFGDVKKK